MPPYFINIFGNHIYTSEAQNYAKNARTSGPLGPLRFKKQKKRKKKVMLPLFKFLRV